LGVGGQGGDDQGDRGGGEEGDATTPTLRVRARTAVLAAGLGSNRLLARVAGLAGGGALSRQRVAAGRYCRLAAWPAAAPPPFSRLIYPLPVDGGLGVHATLDLGGGTRFGPDVDWWCAEEEERGSGGGADALGPAPPDVPATIVPAFEASVRAWWPGLPPGSLAPDYAGLRPKLGGPGDAPSDFLVAGRAVHGAAGVVVLLGVESPGLTASLALADVAVAALDE
jgi:L-2-hydroxyglutarate oxidase LhgO